MRAIRVPAWVEVVGSVMELFHFRVQWNARNISRATLRECGEASSCQEANPMYEETGDSCLPARSCQEANPMYEETYDSLSEGELESTWPCNIQKYCRVQRNREFVPVQMGKMGQTNHEAMHKGRPRRLCEGERCCNSTCWKVPYIGPEWWKLCEVNPVSAINTDEEKLGKRRAEASGNSAPLPHMAHSPRILSGSSRVPGHWEAKSSAVPGRHTAGVGHNYYYY